MVTTEFLICGKKYEITTSVKFVVDVMDTYYTHKCTAVLVNISWIGLMVPCVLAVTGLLGQV